MFNPSEPSSLPLTHQPTVRMPFHVPPSLTRGSSQECEYKDEPSQCETDPPLGILEPSPALIRTIGKTHSRHISQAKRARSPSSDETDDGILRPITPPPIINDLAHFVKCAKLSPTLRIKDSSNTQDRRFFNNQLSHRGSLSVSDAQRVCYFVYKLDRLLIEKNIPDQRCAPAPFEELVFRSCSSSCHYDAR